jgi:ABC-type nitrate/sulfonate/bicarbonate transport system substrate-binding protein
LAASPGKSGTMRVEVSPDADVADIPWLMTVDSLREQGYTIETVAFDNVLGPTAMAQGDLDFASFSNRIAWAAIGKGASFFTFMDKTVNTYMTITGRDIQTCADLDGKSIAVGGTGTVSWTMFDVYLKEHCPGAEPEILIVKGGSNRMAALLTGEVDAAMQDIDDLITIERDRPGQFHPLIVYSQEFPGLHINSYAARRDFAVQHPEMVKDVIRAVFAARRDLQDSQVLREAIVEYLELEPDSAQEMADAYLAQEVWDVVGEYSPETVQATVSFLQEYGDLPVGIEAADVADLSYYEAVLDEIGRR